MTFLHFSLKFLTVAFLFCFIFFVRYVCLFHFFFFLGWEFSFTVQTPCRPNLEFRLVFIEGFLIERVRRGFLVWESDPIPKSKWRRIGKKNREESPKQCSLRLETKGPCESSEPVTVHRTNRSNRGLYGSLFFFFHGTVLHVKQTVKMAGLRFFRLDRTVLSGFQNHALFSRRGTSPRTIFPAPYDQTSSTDH